MTKHEEMMLKVIKKQSKDIKQLVRQEITEIYGEDIKKEIGYLDTDLINRMVDANINPNWAPVKI